MRKGDAMRDTPRRSIAAFAVVAACAVAAHPAAAREDRTFTYRETRTLQPGRATTLVVANRSGEIRVVPGAGPAIRLDVTTTIQARDQQEADRVHRLTLIDSGTSGDNVTVHVTYPSISRRFGIFTVKATGLNDDVALTLTVPPSMRLELSTASGDVSVRGMRRGVQLNATSGDAEFLDIAGPLTCNLTSGDIVIDGADGPVDVRGSSSTVRLNRIQKRVTVRTSSGDVIATRLTMPVEIVTSSGDVKLRDSHGASVQTSSGDVEATSVSGSLTVHTANGEVQLRPEPARGDVIDAQTASGDVSVWLPRGTGADVDVRTTSGDIVSRVPLKVRSATRSGLSGRAGAGGATLRITTVSGNVSVLSAGVSVDDE